MNEFAEPKKVVDLLRDLPCRWGVAGGWALDLFLNRVTRNHKDIEIAIFRVDQLALQTYLSSCGWSFEFVKDGRLYIWPLSERLNLPVHEIWCRKTDGGLRRLEVLLNERSEDEFIFRRDARITIAVDRAFEESAAGIPILAPEIVLLYKSKRADDDKERKDFSGLLDSLELRRRTWLFDSIAKMDAAHPWLAVLKSATINAVEGQ
jgi:hypothetical protein